MIDDSVVDNGYVNDGVEQLRQRVEAAGIVDVCSVERTEDGPVFITFMDEGRIPYGFFQSYGLDLKECRVERDMRSLLRFILGKRQLKAIAVPEGDLDD